MPCPSLLSYTYLTNGQSLNVPSGTRLIVAAFHANPTGVSLGGVAMTLVTNYSTISSIYKYVLPPSGSLLISSVSAGWYFCFANAKDVGNSHSGYNGSGNDSFTLTTGGMDIIVATQKDATSTTSGHHLNAGGSEMYYIENSTYYQTAYAIISAVSCACQALDSNAGGAVEGDSFVTVPYYPDPGGEPTTQLSDFGIL